MLKVVILPQKLNLSNYSFNVIKHNNQKKRIIEKTTSSHLQKEFVNYTLVLSSKQSLVSTTKTSLLCEVFYSFNFFH